MTVGAGLAAMVALFLLAAAVHYRRRLTEAQARAADLGARLEREQALVDTSPEAIVCWDTVTGDQKLSPGAVRMIGCAPDDAIGAEQIAGLVSESRASGIRAAVAALIASGTDFDALVPGPGERRYALRGRSIPQGPGGHLAVAA